MCECLDFIDKDLSSKNLQLIKSLGFGEDGKLKTYPFLSSEKIDKKHHETS